MNKKNINLLADPCDPATIGAGPNCHDCGTPIYCGKPHGSGHDHSFQAVACSAAVMLESYFTDQMGRY